MLGQCTKGYDRFFKTVIKFETISKNINESIS